MLPARPAAPLPWPWPLTRCDDAERSLDRTRPPHPTTTEPPWDCPGSVDSPGRRSGRVSGAGQCPELGGCGSSEAALPSSAVTGLLDGRDDRQPEVLAGGPALPGRDVALQQGGGDPMAASSPQAPTRPIEPVRPLFSSVRTKAVERN